MFAENNHVRRNYTLSIVLACVLFTLGCGTTKWSDTSRTGTEQLLISNAIDNAVGRIDFTPVRDKRVFLKTEAISDVTDNKYLAMTLRQQLAANGGILCDSKDEADYIIEARVGAIGTDRDEMLLVGIPAFTIPSLPGASYSGNIPEIPIIKRTKQRGVAKMAVFAYNKHTGRPIWASGNEQFESSANNLWFAGSGPLTRGTIYDRASFAGHTLPDVFQGKQRRTDSFADETLVFSENPGAPRLKDPSPESEGGEQIAAESPPPAPAPATVYNPLPATPAPQPISPGESYAAPYEMPPSVFDANPAPIRVH